MSENHLIPTLALAALSALAVGCGNSAEDSEYERDNLIPPPLAPPPASAASPANGEDSAPIVATEARRSHNYSERNGIIYSYVAALSEEDRRLGRAAGNVISFAYLGKAGGRHSLAQVLPNGNIINRSYCNEPCRVINYDGGQQVGFNEQSIIGAAFADAIAGHLAVSSITYSQPFATPTASSAPLAKPTIPEDASPEWTKDELALMVEWMGLNGRCRGGSNPDDVAVACAERDGTVSEKLADANICYGRNGQPASQSELHRCENGSLRLDSSRDSSHQPLSDPNI